MEDYLNKVAQDAFYDELAKLGSLSSKMKAAILSVKGGAQRSLARGSVSAAERARRAKMMMPLRPPRGAQPIQKLPRIRMGQRTQTSFAQPRP